MVVVRSKPPLAQSADNIIAARENHQICHKKLLTNWFIPNNVDDTKFSSSINVTDKTFKHRLGFGDSH